MSDVIRVTGLRVRGFHGVLDHERRDGQTFVVDVALTVDTRAAAESDDLALTVDYGVLAERLAADVARDPVDLIETLAQRLADTCLADQRVEAVEVTVHKPEVPLPLDLAEVSTTIVRRRA